jgi:hypothetical protein
VFDRSGWYSIESFESVAHPTSRRLGPEPRIIPGVQSILVLAVVATAFVSFFENLTFLPVTLIRGPDAHCYVTEGWRDEWSVKRDPNLADEVAMLWYICVTGRGRGLVKEWDSYVG